MSERTYIKRIFKYELKIEHRQTLLIPKGAEILDVDRQGPLACLWAAVDPEQPMEPRVIRMVVTGEVYNEERLFYLGHVKLGGEVSPRGVNQGWFEAWFFEVETALPQITPDVISDRFEEDMREVQREVRAVTDEEETYESGELVPSHRKVPA